MYGKENRLFDLGLVASTRHACILIPTSMYGIGERVV